MQPKVGFGTTWRNRKVTDPNNNGPDFFRFVILLYSRRSTATTFFFEISGTLSSDHRDSSIYPEDSQFLFEMHKLEHVRLTRMVKFRRTTDAFCTILLCIIDNILNLPLTTESDGIMMSDVEDRNTSFPHYIMHWNLSYREIRRFFTWFLGDRSYAVLEAVVLGEWQ